MATRALLVGSVNLGDTEEVLRESASRAGAVVERIPDGETGDRLVWAAWQIGVIQAHPDFELDEVASIAGLERPRFRLREGVDAARLSFGDLGYAAVARESYATFARLREEGAIAPGTRFQVSLPTPGAVMLVFINPAQQFAVEPAYEAALLREVEQMAAAIPHEDLAIQWDAPAEVGQVERVFPAYYASDDVYGEAIARLARLGEGVPAGVQLGFHLCYGDTGDLDDPEGAHWKNPDDLAVVTRLMNGVTQACDRHVDWFHVPVPIRRDDEAYFAPLAELKLDAGTELYLGLLHREDGIEGARRRSAAARAFVSDFGVSTECGIGRERREDVPGLLTLHATAADADVRD